MGKNNKKIGAWGEQLAKVFFNGLGYDCISYNWTRKIGEIDLIFTQGKEIVFVEVKTRTTSFCGWAEDAVTSLKKQKISSLIDQFLLVESKYRNYFPRFDILVIELFSSKPNFIHYENVTLI